VKYKNSYFYTGDNISLSAKQMKNLEGTNGQKLNKIKTDFNTGLIYEKLLG